MSEKTKEPSATEPTLDDLQELLTRLHWGMADGGTDLNGEECTILHEALRQLTSRRTPC